MEVFGHFVFPRFLGFFLVSSFIYRLFRAFLFTILFRHFVLPPIQAGAYQIKSGTSKPEWQIYKEETRYNFSKLENLIPYKEKVIQPPYGDDPRDQKWIKSGFQYFKNKKQ
ncbi:MAG: hypothetical protein ACTTJM_09165 [Bergeyella cardium]